MGIMVNGSSRTPFYSNGQNCQTAAWLISLMTWINNVDNHNLTEPDLCSNNPGHKLLKDLKKWIDLLSGAACARHRFRLNPPESL